MKLTPAMLDALYKFSNPGGHGFGEYAYLARSTTLALARLGYVTIGSRTILGWGGAPRSIAWAVLTETGLEAFRATGTSLAPRELASNPPDFTPWATIPATRRNGKRLDAKTLRTIAE